MTKQLVVKNLVQKALFLCEFEGQISDGMWENSGPRDHYRDWMLTTNEIIVNPKIQGRNFYAIKDNYNLNSTSLRECVGDRMLFVARMTTFFPTQTSTLLANVRWLPESLAELKEAFTSTCIYGYQIERKNILEAIGLPFSAYESAFNADKINYDEMDLRKDIAELRKAMKTFTNVDGIESFESFCELKAVEESINVTEILDSITTEVLTSETKKQSILIGSTEFSIKFEGNGWYQLDTEFNTFWKIETIHHDNPEMIMYVTEAKVL